jgi:hypothetical protein
MFWTGLGCPDYKLILKVLIFGYLISAPWTGTRRRLLIYQNFKQLSNQLLHNRVHTGRCVSPPEECADLVT